MINVIMHSLGIISSLWAITHILALLSTFNEPEVKYLGRRVTIRLKFFIPFALVIVYVVWLFIG